MGPAAALLGAARPLLEALTLLNKQVLAAVVLMQMTASSFYYFHAFKPAYMRLVNVRQAVYTSNQLPTHPLRSLLGTAGASMVLALVIQLLAVRFGVNTFAGGLQMAAALLIIDTCLNARHHFFEGRPLQLFLLHAGYHALVLVGCCCLLAVFGQPADSLDASSVAAGGGGGSSGGGEGPSGAHQTEL
ncbi:hypothetical protein C2E21_2823 [Chlorella sorokiniana]|uniref:Uncharacterized protein n=1 Tax=Chlorella sorokiniana TaxID=3076 RepID=A0A2P6TWJ6_CHLSO|nr:hypothetical protein C2E21_2823 [Chlorella sorokiniana]|eukprot:PRW58432.1 hypothetical protein C2E21_2823 [Chlorella sorokiniana]